MAGDDDAGLRFRRCVLVQSFAGPEYSGAYNLAVLRDQGRGKSAPGCEGLREPL